VKIPVPIRARRVGLKPAAYLSTYHKLLGRLAAVFLGTATLAGIVSIRNTPEVSVVNAVPTQTEVIQAPKSEAAVASEPVADPITSQTISTAPLIGDFGFSLGSSNQPAQTPPTIKAKESLTDLKPQAIPSPLHTVAEAPQPTPEPTAARKEFVEISVQLTIEDGRVAAAQIGDPTPGAEAFEATALHIAKQRRYPPGTSRIETVVVRIANQSGRNEP